MPGTPTAVPHWPPNDWASGDSTGPGSWLPCPAASGPDPRRVRTRLRSRREHLLALRPVYAGRRLFLAARLGRPGRKPERDGGQYRRDSFDHQVVLPLPEVQGVAQVGQRVGGARLGRGDLSPIEQQAVLLAPGAGDPAPRAFLAFLKSAEAKAIIRRYGYEVR